MEILSGLLMALVFLLVFGVQLIIALTGLGLLLFLIMIALSPYALVCWLIYKLYRSFKK
jgi:hypothetical protein